MCYYEEVLDVAKVSVSLAFFLDSPPLPAVNNRCRQTSRREHVRGDAGALEAARAVSVKQLLGGCSRWETVLEAAAVMLPHTLTNADTHIPLEPKPKESLDLAWVSLQTT